MKKNKVILAISLGVFLLIVFAAYLYTYKFSNFIYDSGMEYHIYPEEFDEEYSEHIETIMLERNTDYKINVEATCQTGTMELTIHYADGNDKKYSIDNDSPYYEVIDVKRNAGDEVIITVSYNDETEGVFKDDVYRHKHYFLI